MSKVRSSRAVVQTGAGKLEVHEFEVPAIGPDDALLRLELCGICGTDIEQYDGRLAEKGYTSSLQGIEARRGWANMLSTGRHRTSRSLGSSTMAWTPPSSRWGRVPATRMAPMCSSSGAWPTTRVPIGPSRWPVGPVSESCWRPRCVGSSPTLSGVVDCRERLPF